MFLKRKTGLRMLLVSESFMASTCCCIEPNVGRHKSLSNWTIISSKNEANHIVADVDAISIRVECTEHHCQQ